jgi:hypothetical protein
MAGRRTDDAGALLGTQQGGGGGGAMSTVYVTNLPADIKSNEVEAIFDRYGRIRNVDVKGGTRGSERRPLLLLQILLHALVCTSTALLLLRPPPTPTLPPQSSPQPSLLRLYRL